MSEENTALVKVDDLKNQIAQFTTIEECKEERDKIETVRAFLKRKGNERSMVQILNAGAVRLAWKMGKILGEVISPGRPTLSEEGEKEYRLADFGITKTTSHNYQKVSEIPENVLDKRLEKFLASGEEISEKEFYRFAKSLEEVHHEEPEGDDGTSRMDESNNTREAFVAMTREQVQAFRKQDIPGIDLLTDDQIELISIGIIETVMAGSGKYKKKIEKFIGENALDENNYWDGFSLIYRQINSVRSSLLKNTTELTPKSLLFFMQNLKSLMAYVKSWKPGGLQDCAKCNGTQEIPVPENEGGDPGQTVPCDYCFEGKTGWFKG